MSNNTAVQLFSMAIFNFLNCCSHLPKWTLSSIIEEKKNTHSSLQ